MRSLPLATQLGVRIMLNINLLLSTALSTLLGTSKMPMRHHSAVIREQHMMLFSTRTAQTMTIPAERRKGRGTLLENGPRQQEVSFRQLRARSGGGSTREARNEQRHLERRALESPSDRSCFTPISCIPSTHSSPVPVSLVMSRTRKQKVLRWPKGVVSGTSCVTMGYTFLFEAWKGVRKLIPWPPEGHETAVAALNIKQPLG